MNEQENFSEQICKNCKLFEEGFCLKDKKKEPTKPEDHCSEWESAEEQNGELLREAYDNIMDILKEYLDLREDYYNIIALWIIGTYSHDKFNSYPFLFFNAIKGSGKTRTLNLITTLAKDGEMLLSPTEAVLFRTKGTLGIDEFESIGRQGIESVRELLNASYKKGAKVKRMKQRKTLEGIEQVVEEFEVYRPIVMANIWGMESVLGDRCIQLILEKSSDKKRTNLIELFREEEVVILTKKILSKCSLCSSVVLKKVYREWNNFVKSNYTNYIYNTNNRYNTNCIQAFKSINLMELGGRDLELCLPLCLIASLIPEKSEKETTLLEKTTLTLKNIFSDKNSEELIENYDISLIEFISQETGENFKTIKGITEEFRIFLNTQEEWINYKWMGRALKRMNLIKAKRRQGRGVEIILNIQKAQEKIKIFK